MSPLFRSSRGVQRDTLICLHSSASSGRQWRDTASALASRFEVLAPELLGYTGDAEWPLAGPLSLDHEAAHLAPLLNARPEGVHLLAHSYGGAVALQMALRWPSRILSLTLYEPVRFALLFGDPARMQEGVDVMRIGRRIGSEVLAGRSLSAAGMFVDYWNRPGAWATLSPRQQQGLALRMPKVRAEFEALFADTVPAVAYRRLAMPTRLLMGSASPAPARSVAQALAQRLPHADLVTLPGAGHMAPMTDSAALLAHLPRWLQPAALVAA